MSRAFIKGMGCLSAVQLTGRPGVAASRTAARRLCSQRQRRLVLGIESSCDETGAAVVDDTGHLLGEAIHSQHLLHLRFGGIIPPIAADLHALHMEPVVTKALQEANVSLKDLDAIAVTVQPGLALSLVVGMNYAKKLSRESGKPLIPIHHMEAHALTVRMVKKVEFPFMVLLISGGHCLICVVRDVADFLLLGQSIDDAPGEAFDKTARRLKLRNLPECATMSGGAAVEYMARRGDPSAFQFTVPLYKFRDCNFSFSGLKNEALKIIYQEEAKHGIAGGAVLPNAADICAVFQYTTALTFIRRLHRATIYCENKNLLPNNRRVLVVSGGVACNQFIRNALQQFCDHVGYELECPPPKLCTDNGIMIAWNGMERLLANVGVTHDLNSVDILAKSPLGQDLTEDVRKEDIKLKNFKLNFESMESTRFANKEN